MADLLGISVGGTGGKTDQDIGTIYWDQIERLLNLDEQYNRINRYGPFGGWEYDPETKTQSFTATSPGMQQAVDRMDWRMQGGGFTPYTPPAGVYSMSDALMANKLHRQGVLDPNLADPTWSLRQTEYGTRMGDNPGSGWQSQWDVYTPPVDQGRDAPDTNPDAPSPPGGAAPPGYGDEYIPPGVVPMPGPGGGGGGGIQPNAITPIQERLIINALTGL